MKKQFLLLFAIVFTFVACKTDKKDHVDTTDGDETVKTTTDGENISLDASESYVNWVGGKVVGNDNHNGKIKMESGNFVVKDGKLVGGEFIVDMNSLTNEDITDEGMNQKLVGHLKNSDFFEVDTYPTAKFTILKVNYPEDGNADGHELEGTLTIKGNAKNITVPATVEVNGDDVSVESSFNIDRTEFNVNFRSSVTDVVKDKAIKDVVELKVVAKS